MARLNGSLRFVVISYVNKPKAIAIDPIAGYLFYIGGDKKGKDHLLIEITNQLNKTIHERFPNAFHIIYNLRLLNIFQAHLLVDQHWMEVIK